jgi:hypothetical protein
MESGFERVKNTGLFKEKLSDGYARHHIINIGDMELLWMLGKSSPALEEAIWGGLVYFTLKPHYALDEEGRLPINTVAWAPWNLFVGCQSAP